METYDRLKPYVNMREHENEEITQIKAKEFKILIVGDTAVGKSSVCERYCMNEFSLEIKPSTQVECYPKLLQIFNSFIRIYLIDILSEKFDALPQEVLKGVNGAIIIYDVTKTKSFEDIDQWMDKLKAKFGISIPYMILGNKSDLNFLRNVDEDEAYEKATALKCDFREISCIEDEEEKKEEEIKAMEENEEIKQKSEYKGTIKDSINYLISRIYYMNLPESEKEKVQKLSEEDKDK